MVSNGLPDDACMDRARAQVIMDRLYNMETTYTIQDFFSGWFRGADPDDIGHENLKDFTAYGFFGSKLEDLSPQVSSKTKKTSLNHGSRICQVPHAFQLQLHQMRCFAAPHAIAGTTCGPVDS